MSSETSTKSDQLQVWQLFTLAALAAASAVVFVSKDAGPAGVILLSLTIGAAAFASVAAWRALAPLANVQEPSVTEVLGGRTRAALEREKVLVLRSIKDLEFDRAMGKVSDKDFADMDARLRQRAAGLLQQLDRGSGYRDQIEKELAKRVGAPNAPREAAASQCPSCATSNDLDARFCKNCGDKLKSA